MGYFTDTIWSVCTVVVLLRSTTPTLLLRLFVVVITITTWQLLLLLYPCTHSSLTDFALFALICPHRPFAVLRQAGFPYPAFPQLYAVGRNQAGTAKQRSPKHITPNWLSKEGEAGSQVCFHIYHQSWHTFLTFSRPRFPACFSTYPNWNPTSTLPHHIIFFFPLICCLFPLAAFWDTRENLSNC